MAAAKHIRWVCPALETFITENTAKYTL